MRDTRRGWLVGLAVLWLLCPPAAGRKHLPVRPAATAATCTADEPDPAKLEERASQLVAQAEGKGGAEQTRTLEAALQCYRLAEEKNQGRKAEAGKIQGRMGVALELLGRPAEAVSAYERFLSQVPEPERKPGSTGYVQERLKVLTPQVGRIAVLAGAGEEVSIDGSAVGKAPFRRPVAVMPGTRLVTVGTRQEAVAVKAGEVATVDLREKRTEAAVTQAATAQVGTSKALSAPGVLSSEQPARRPLWRYVVGGLGIAAGLAMVSVGAAGLALNGTCVDQPACMEIYRASPGGMGAWLGAGSALTVGGVLILALPPRKAR